MCCRVADMVTVPIRLTFSVDDEKKDAGPRHSSSESSSEESDASEESLPDLEKEMKEQLLKQGKPTSGEPSVCISWHSCIIYPRCFVP